MTTQDIEEIFNKKATQLNARGALLDSTKKNLQDMKNHDLATYHHQLRVALVASRLAEEMGNKDVKPEFFGGANHDVGKLQVDGNFLREKNLQPEQYEQIKKHAVNGRQSLEEFLFISAIAAAHHSFQENSYGLTLPEVIGELALPKKALERLESALVNVSMADYYDACNTRETGVIWQKNKKNCQLIANVYPDHPGRVNVILNDPFIASIYSIS